MMDAKQAIADLLGQAEFLVNAYLADMAPEELLARPAPGANHIAWQLGHLISAEEMLLLKAVVDAKGVLPAGFGEKYNKVTAASDDPAAFLSKDEYLKLARDVRQNTLSVLEGLAPADLDRPVSGRLPPFIKTSGHCLVLIGSHWVLHAGQWVVTRRKLGRPPLF